jgi:hypothetical protein
MTQHYTDDIATGSSHGRRLTIAGRPAAGGSADYVLLEEPEEPVLMHWRDRLVPHFRHNCPHCNPDGTSEPKPLWYVGAQTLVGQLVIVELNETCFQAAAAAARNIETQAIGHDLFGQPVKGAGVFRGLLVKISRSSAARSRRVLRCEQRVQVAAGAWPYVTRRELCKIWGVPVRPRLYREGEAG